MRNGRALFKRSVCHGGDVLGGDASGGRVFAMRPTTERAYLGDFLMGRGIIDQETKEAKFSWLNKDKNKEQGDSNKKTNSNKRRKCSGAAVGNRARWCVGASSYRRR
jgi:hypothetical protein